MHGTSVIRVYVSSVNSLVVISEWQIHIVYTRKTSLGTCMHAPTEDGCDLSYGIDAIDGSCSADTGFLLEARLTALATTMYASTKK